MPTLCDDLQWNTGLALVYLPCRRSHITGNFCLLGPSLVVVLGLLIRTWVANVIGFNQLTPNMLYSKRQFWLVQLVGFGTVFFLIVVAFLPFKLDPFEEVTGTAAFITCALLPFCASLYDGTIAWRMRGTRKRWLPGILAVIGLVWVLFFIAAATSL
jgi:hypothetical protein